ncbi:MAG: tyrosine-protein phosphatase [Treponema sp.]|jgi:protein tyrosine/serine phosphatase|nr:tyrosine-protein phosphatase [Treponema sp.]
MVIKSSNFREINSGKIAPKLLYRSDHPICNGKQVKDIILSANNANIQTIINLSDSIHSVRQKTIHCPWYRKMLEKNNVIALDIRMDFNIMDSQFNKKIKDGLIFIIKHNPPYLIHCEAGIDRTGFLSIMLEAFMETKFDDMVKDYMLSYVDESEYSLNDYRNGSIFIMNIFGKIKGEIINQNENLQYLSTKYFLEKIKLNAAEVQMLSNKIMNKEV